MAIKVIQWATGGVGKAAIECVMRHPELELVGCWVHSPDKHGRDVGTILGGEPIGVNATTDIEQLLALDADCVVYAPLVPRPRDVKAILVSGKNVVTPVGWVYPDRGRAADIEAACRAGGVSLHGTGIHPGGITERFPLMVSALSAAITHVRAEEFSDVRTYSAPDVLGRIMGFGATPEVALNSPMASFLSEGFSASVRMVVDEMGFGPISEIRATQDVAVATAPIESPIGVIEPGLVAARRFRWDAIVGDRPVVTAAVNWLMGDKDLDREWSLGKGGERFEIEVEGDPPVLVTFKGLQPESVAAGLVRNPGVVATANHCVNAIPYVCRAEPGIRTFLDLPLLAGRAAPQVSTRR